MLLTVTIAPGTTAPEGSVTRPEMDAETCACSEALTARASTTRTMTLLRTTERGPGMRIQIAKRRLLPVEFRVLLDVVGGFKIDTVGVPHGRVERHMRQHRRIGGLVLHRSGRAECRLPGSGAARRQIDVAAQRPLAGRVLVLEGIVMIGLKFLGRRDVDLAFVL